jgi:predicted methyltransferase
MRLSMLAVGGAHFLAACATTPPPANYIPPYVAAAVTDSGRPAADTARDPDRKPSETLAFAGVRPGMTVVDLIPGGGYFTRIFSKAVGPKGRVYAYVPDELSKLVNPPRPPAIAPIIADPQYKNVTMLLKPVSQFSVPEPVDMVWTSQNYHDMHAPFFGPVNMANLNRAVFEALKPGGVYIVLDHSATPGSGTRDAATLHRIDPDAVRAEVTAAGFVFESESMILRNPSDDRSLRVQEGAIRGHTDQFVYKFRKPR